MSGAQTFGYSCFNCEKQSASSTDPENSSAHVEVLALLAGWQIGLDAAGQAHYGCKACAPLLFDPTELYPTHWPANAVNQLWVELRTGQWEVA